MWNPIEQLLAKINARGGYVNAHSYLDKAYSVEPTDLLNKITHKSLIVNEYKKKSTIDSYYEHMITALRQQKKFGVQAVLSFIDVDLITEDKTLKAAKMAQEYASKELNMRLLLACQTENGLIDKDARNWFEKSLEYVDIIGGLPAKDKGKEHLYLDILLSRGKELNKRVHVYVDQLNASNEKETELLAKKTIEWGMESKVTAINAMSLAAHSKEYRQKVYKMCKDADLSFVTCPTAWINFPRNEELSPVHNAIIPLDELCEYDISVAIGSANIADVYKPYSDGNMSIELRLLYEANNFYNEEQIINVATKNGLLVLGL